jgi:hypothetical protein
VRIAAALRNLFNRFLSQLHHCLATGQTYDPDRAFPVPTTAAAGLTSNPRGPGLRAYGNRVSDTVSTPEF